MTDRRIEKILSLIEEDRFSRLSVRHLADSVNLSVSRTRHLFKQETGITLGQHINTLRMRRAKHLLKTSFLSVKEIVAKLGRSDQSHFGRNYKKTFGVSPAKYRSELRS